MNTEILNRRLWTVAKWGVPATIIFIVLAAIFKLRLVIIIVDIFGALMLLTIIAAVITEVVLYAEHRENMWPERKKKPTNSASKKL